MKVAKNRPGVLFSKDGETKGVFFVVPLVGGGHFL